MQEYEPGEPTRWCSMLRALTKPAWNEASPFMDQLIEWERQIRVYEAGSGDRVTNPLKCAIVTGQAPLQVRSFLRLSPVDYAGDYLALRAAVRAYLSKGRRYGDDGASLAYDPMDVGAVWPDGKSIGKGKQIGGKSGKGGKGGRSDYWRDAQPLGQSGQPRGAGRGGGGQQWWSAGQRPQPGPRGGCFTCGGPHRQQDCPKARKGKGKSATPAKSNPDTNLQCGRCKLWGHRRKNCRRVMAIEEEENAQVPALVGGVSRWEEEEPLIAMLESMEDTQELEVAQRRGKLGMSMRRGLPESEAGMSVRHGLPKPDPSGIVAKTPPVSVTKPLGRAFVANDPGVIPAEILTDTVREHTVCPVVT